jgi:SAM-dependent methyltransferase
MSEELPEEIIDNYDVVCMFHVLEHISKPKEFLNNIKKCLNDSGKLIVEVPNFLDYNKNLSTAYNDFTYMRAHLSYFTPDTLMRLLETTGFSGIEIRGAQRYSIENAIWWIRNGKPHTEYQQLELPSGLEWANQLYKEGLEKGLASYAIIAFATLTNDKECIF